MYLNLLVCDQNIFFKSLQQSLVIFDILSIGDLLNFSEIFVPKRSCGLPSIFREPLEIFEKWSEIFGKLSKMWLSVWLHNEQNNKWLQAEYLFSCSALHLTHKILNWRLKEIHVFYIILYQPMYYTLLHHTTLN